MFVPSRSHAGNVVANLKGIIALFREPAHQVTGKRLGHIWLRVILKKKVHPQSLSFSPRFSPRSVDSFFQVELSKTTTSGYASLDMKLASDLRSNRFLWDHGCGEPSLGMLLEMAGESGVDEWQKLATNDWGRWMVRLILVDSVHQCGRGILIV